MSYSDRLHPWCIVRLLPNLRRVVVARFRRRNDAEEHLKLLRQMTPDVAYAIVFDVPCNPDPTVEIPEKKFTCRQCSNTLRRGASQRMKDE